MSSQVVAGKYILRRVVGRGGMGVVWEALDQTLQRLVALKQLSSEASVGALGLFEREAMAIAKLRHEHIVMVHDYGMDDGSPYLVMELLEGEDLATRLLRQRTLSPAVVVSLLRQVASGLAEAHAAGIVHRDIKPANIFLARTSTGEEVVKLLDFGLVWSHFEASSAALAPVGFRGTPAYMSPEQARGVVPTPLTDVWSLGVVAYRALTGRLPFGGETTRDLIVSVCTDDCLPPSALVPELPPTLDAFFERALAKDTTRRFQSAAELIAALRIACEGSSAPTKVLVVDDEPDVQVLLEMQLRQKVKEGVYALLFAENGRAAVDLLREHPDVDVVLSDIKMPVMDGIALLSHVSAKYPLTRTVMVSAYGDMSNVRRAMNLGAFDFILKPIERADLETTLEKTRKLVQELRKSARADEENHALRTFTRGSLLARLRALGPSAAMASEATDATVVVIDVFPTAGALEACPPAETVRLRNANFEVVVPEIVAKGGVMERFSGEVAVAVFRGPEHTDRALDAALAARSQTALMAQRAGEGSPYAHGVTIGVSTGSVVSGALGSRAAGQLDYVVLGEVVSAAASLARVAERGEILVASTVRDATPEGFIFWEAGLHALGPREAPLVAYHLARKSLSAELGPDETTAAAEVGAEALGDTSDERQV